MRACVRLCICWKQKEEGGEEEDKCPFYFFKTELAMLNMKIKNREKLSAGFPLINNNNANHSGVTPTRCILCSSYFKIKANLNEYGTRLSVRGGGWGGTERSGSDL